MGKQACVPAKPLIDSGESKVYRQRTRRSRLGQRRVADIVVRRLFQLTHKNVNALLGTVDALLKRGDQLHPALIGRDALLQLERLALEHTHDSVKLRHRLAEGELLDRLLFYHRFLLYQSLSLVYLDATSVAGAAASTVHESVPSDTCTATFEPTGA